MLRSAGTIAALAIPKGDESNLLSAKTSGGLKHPSVNALVGIFAGRKRAQLIRHHMQRRPRFDCEKAVVPIGVGKIDRVGQEDRFVKRNVELEHHVSRKARFGKQQIAAACAAANGKIASGDTNL